MMSQLLICTVWLSLILTAATYDSAHICPTPTLKGAAAAVAKLHSCVGLANHDRIWL
jgi:hypothetical protein